MKAPSEEKVDQIVDSTYSLKAEAWKYKEAVIIGEFKRGLIDPYEWQDGKLETIRQQTLSRELRGSAILFKSIRLLVISSGPRALT